MNTKRAHKRSGKNAMQNNLLKEHTIKDDNNCCDTYANISNSYGTKRKQRKLTKPKKFALTICSLVIVMVLSLFFVASSLATTAPVVPTGASVFTYPIEAQTQDGTTTTIDCRFAVVSNNEVFVYGNGNLAGQRAIDTTFAGSIKLPEQVIYGATTYTVTGIDTYAFGGIANKCCTNLTSIEMPSTIYTIAKYAFYNCTSLGNTTLPSSLTIVDEYAFYGCTSITDITFPQSIQSVGSYAFCQCFSLSNIRFECDATCVEKYAFTGNMYVKNVIYEDKALDQNNSSSYFNSDSSPAPTFYYTVKFYGSQDDATQEKNLLGKVVLANSVKYKDIYHGMTAAYEGEVPEYPSNTNLWVFEGSPAQHNTISNSLYAYPIYSKYRNLAYGSATFPDCNYSAASVEPTLELYIERQGKQWLVSPTLIVNDMNGTQLEYEKNYTVTYQRQNSSGTWIDTTDLTNPGVVQITIKGVAPYEGSISTTFEIKFGEGCTFVSDIDCTSAGTTSKVSCAFKITSLDGNTGTVSVSPRVATKQETAEQKSTRAVDLELSGDIKIPETIEAFGTTFEVNKIEDGAFGSVNDANSASCSKLTGVSIPSTVQKIGTKAFNSCSSLEKIIFEGDLDNATFGASTFFACTSLKDVIFYGKKPSDARYALSSIFSGSPNYYYTITFYESQNAKQSGADPIGTVTISDDVILGDIPDKPTDKDIIYSGSIPDYPSSLIDDTNNPTRHYYAPMWIYPEVDADQRVQMQSTLTDSVDAYAIQMQDAFAIDDAIVLGIESKYKWSGSPAVDTSQVKVYSNHGGRLTQDKDYTIAFERLNSNDEWEQTDDLISGGDLRAVIKGVGRYVSTTRQQTIEFKITTSESAVGTTFTYNVDVTDIFGNVSKVPCTFQTTSLGQNRSAMVYAKDGSTPAVGRYTTSGKVTIPEYAECNGVPYKVTAISDYAFDGCENITQVSLPSSVTTLGMASFYSCKSLTEAQILDGMTEVPQSIYNGCTSLKRVTLPDSVETINNWAFSGCTSLEDINLPSSLQTIKDFAFSNCSSLNSITIPKSLTDYSTAFRNTGIKNLSFEEGIKEIPDSAFDQCKNLTQVNLPNSIESIGEYAFSRTAITYLELPWNLVEVDEYAFYSSNQLSTVVFDGDPAVIEFGTGAFSACGNIDQIVYRKNALRNASEIFPLLSNSAKIYSGITFYASQEDYEQGLSLGVAYVEHGTQLRLVYSDTLPQQNIYDGSVPNLPNNTNMWVFDEGRPINEKHDGQAIAIAQSGDETDLSTGYVVTNGAYAYTGSTVDPFVDGTGMVITSSGKQLARGSNYTISFERQNASGEWVSSTNRTSRGTIKIVATAIEGGGYTGQAIGYYSITEYMVGSTFVDKDANGNDITYLVLEGGNSEVPGKVAVGVGGSSGNYQLAADISITGALEIPEIVHDPRGVAYEPTEISPYAFYRCTNITSIKVPASITYIGEKAFAYEREKTDVKTSSVEKIEFMNDLSKCSTARSAFTGCDIVKTVVYNKSKGNFEKVSPLQTKAGITTTYYCTARYFNSIEDLRKGEDPIATVVIKEGSYLFSPSLSDYMTRSDKAPLADTGYAWVYDEDAQDEEGRITDSQNIYAHEILDNTIVANVKANIDGSTQDEPCVFSILTNPSADANGTVSVGRMSDGSPALQTSARGKIIIPETITSEGKTYDVVEVGPFAFGSSEQDRACTSITGVELPASVESIEQAAFMNCAKLATVDFAANSQLTSIGAAAFSQCSSLSKIELPQELTTILASAFDGCSLEKVVLPPHLSKLGKRAFNSCKQLKEVVFAGAMHLELPAVDGASQIEPTSARYTSDNANMSLDVLDDYTFANCSKLSRLVFEADASNLSVSEVAFEGSSTISKVVFGAGSTNFELQTSPPDIYYTVSYFDSLQNKDLLNRLAYVVVPAQTIIDTLSQDQIYAGSVPELKEHYEWQSSFDSSSPLDNSAYMCMVPIVYQIDTSRVDAAFSINILVAGQTSTSASYGEEVEVQVESQTQAQPSGFRVTSATTGDLIYESQTNAGKFVMPGEDVNISVGYNMDLKVYVQKPKATEPTEHTLSIEQIEAVSSGSASPTKQGDDLYYSSWDMYRESNITKTNEYISLGKLAELVGVDFDEGDSLVFESTQTGSNFTLSYNDIEQFERLYYPNIQNIDPDGGIKVMPSLAIRSVTANTYMQNIDELQTSMSSGYKLCLGQRERELLNIVDTQSNCISQVDKITILCGAQTIQNCTVTGLDDGFYYTGEQIKPQVEVYDPDQTLMEEGVDYTISYGENIDAGFGSVTITGIGAYTGSADFAFKIKRLQTIAGSNRDATAASIALQTYPQGSKGAILASSQNFPDALSATALSGALGYPIVLTGQGSLSTEAREAIAALSAGYEEFEVIVVGGDSAVSQEARLELLPYVYNENFIVALAGNDRYSTSYAVYDYGKMLGIWGDSAIVASGTSFADALAISPYASAYSAPIMLSSAESINDEFLQALSNDGFSNSIIVGGTGVIDSNVQSQLSNVLGSSNILRLGGKDRYDTCSKIVDYELSQGMTCNKAGLASGQNFPDALATSSMLSKTNSVLLLVSSDNTSTLDVLSNYSSDIAHIFAIGGTSAVPMDIKTKVLDLLSWSKEALL